MTEWTSRFGGAFDGRQIEILVYGDKESFKVKTTQKAFSLASGEARQCRSEAREDHVRAHPTDARPDCS
jgi:hypothetical protein